MRIAMFSQWWPPEPANIVGSLGRELAARGHQVDVVTGFPNYPSGQIYDGYRLRWRQVEDDNGMRIVRVPLYPSHDRSATHRIANYVSFGVTSAMIGVPSLRNVDVAYVYHPPITSAWPAMVLKALKRVPFVLHVQDLWPDSVTHAGMLGNGSKARAVESLLNRACTATYRAAAHIVVISPGFKEILTSRGVPADKISVVYNWADESIHHPDAVDPETRSILGPCDRRIVLYAGNMGDYQNLDVAIRAAASLEHTTNLDLVLMGNGLARPELERLVEELGASNVRFLPSVKPEQMSKFNASADALLVSLKDLPFFAATIPGKTQVALKAGRPVVMAVRGDAADIVGRAQAGLVGAPTQDGLTTAFGALAASDDAELRSFGANGRAAYESQFSLSQGASEIEQILGAAGSVGSEAFVSHEGARVR
jgi:glycosyltransferase involved in cell wall biosynthesis